MTDELNIDGRAAVLRTLLAGLAMAGQAIAFAFAILSDKEDRYRRIQRTLIRFDYNKLKTESSKPAAVGNLSCACQELPRRLKR